MKKDQENIIEVTNEVVGVTEEKTEKVGVLSKAADGIRNNWPKIAVGAAIAAGVGFVIALVKGSNNNDSDYDTISKNDDSDSDEEVED